MIYICIPVHNEERTIGVLLWKIRQVLADFPRDYQILVANDGSTDGTAQVLAPYERVLPLTVFESHKPRGYATSLEQLLREAVRRAEYPKRDVIITLQGDFTDDPDSITAMMKKIEAGADLVCAESSVPPATNRAHRWARSIGGYLVARKKWPEGVTDPLCGFRAYRVMIVKRAIEQRAGQRLLSWQGWVANAELLQQVAPHSRRNESVPTETRLDRLQRPSRHHLWPALKAMFGFARGARGPLAHSAIEAGQAREEERGRRRRGAHGDRDELEALRDRVRQTRLTPIEEETNGGRRTRGRRPARGQGERPPRGERSQRERPPRGERSQRGEKSQRAERPPREQPAQKRRARQRPQREVLPDATRDPLAPEEPPVLNDAAIAADSGAGEALKKKRRRRRRKRSGEPNGALDAVSAEVAAEGGSDAAPAAEAGNDGEAAGEVRKKRRSRRGRGRRGRGRREGGAPTPGAEGVDAPAAPPSVDSSNGAE